jgi:hypothetical protein
MKEDGTYYFTLKNILDEYLPTKFANSKKKKKKKKKNILIQVFFLFFIKNLINILCLFKIKKN